ncbi:MAG TPA: non-homologous end-joining DNA ligase [Vicinamibacterales bacterium]|nr:non-homologous end-joining DNA ligase [Vicinamibacterales bacterium]
MARVIPVFSAQFVEPMAAQLVSALPDGDEWLYEAKFDGYRALALKNGASVRLLSRKGNDLTADYPAIRDAVAALKATSAVIDGEIVAFDESGRPSFQHLHHRSANPAAICYFAFDLLHLEGKDLRASPLEERRASLQTVLRGSGVEFSAELPGTPDDVVRAIASVGLEGVVAKRRDSKYEAGKRSGVWQKFKVQLRQEFVIGGYKPENRNFQSIVVGYYEHKKLRFAARVRAGFTAAQRAALFEVLHPLKVEKCPFTDLPSSRTGHWGEGVTVEDMKVLKWVKPTLAAEIAFTEWTRDGNLRHSAFVGLRTDKDAREVVREHPTG